MDTQNLKGISYDIKAVLQVKSITIEQIASGEIDLTEINGIGKKTAELLVEQAKAMIAQRDVKGGKSDDDSAPEPVQGDGPPMSERVRRIAESAGS